MLLLSTIVLLPALVLGCADVHAKRQNPTLERRAEGGVNWTYEASYNWHTLSPGMFNIFYCRISIIFYSRY